MRRTDHICRLRAAERAGLIYIYLRIVAASRAGGAALEVVAVRARKLRRTAHLDIQLMRQPPQLAPHIAHLLEMTSDKTLLRLAQTLGRRHSGEQLAHRDLPYIY